MQLAYSSPTSLYSSLLLIIINIIKSLGVQSPLQY